MKKQKLTDQLTSALGKAAAKIDLEIKKGERNSKTKKSTFSPPPFSGRKSTEVIPSELRLTQVAEKEKDELARGTTYTLYQNQKNKVAEVNAWAQRLVGPNKPISRSIIVRLAIEMLQINESTKEQLFKLLDQDNSS